MRLDLDPSKLYFEIGLVKACVCAPASASTEDVEHEINWRHPTGIASRWEILAAEGAKGPTPEPCAKDPTRVHWHLAC